MDKLKILEWVSYQKEHLEQVRKISDYCFGWGYFSSDFYIKYENRIFVTLVRISDTIIGYAMGIVVEKGQVPEELTKYHTALWDVEVNYPCYYIKEMAVLPEYQRQGIGNNMLFHQLQLALTRQYRQVFYFHWNESETSGFSSKLLKTGFMHAKTIHNFWYKDSLEHDFYCPRCISPPCKCSVSVYEYHISKI